MNEKSDRIAEIIEKNLKEKGKNFEGWTEFNSAPVPSGEIVRTYPLGDTVTGILYSDGTLVISGTGPMYNYSSGSLVPFYLNKSSITSVVINSGVTTIGNRVFFNCTCLKSITIPNSVTSIGLYAFFNCSSLTAVNIPDSVRSIGDYAFENCVSLTSVNIPDSVKVIGVFAFSSCISLASIAIPNSVTNIGIHAFLECRSLTSVTIPDSVTTIQTTTFYNCTSLASVTIPDSVTRIDSNAFHGYTALTSIVIPASVTSIGSKAFWGCTSLKSITVLYNGSNQLIGTSAFATNAPGEKTADAYSANTNFINAATEAGYTINYLDQYTVTFKDWNGTVLKTETVKYGESAIPPDNPTRTGYTFIGWRGTYSNVTSDQEVIAAYELMS